MRPEDEEGWFTDPFGRHEARWMSNGTPSKLVRDQGVESYDEPPDEAPTRTPERIAEKVDAPGGADLLRVDEPGELDDLSSIARREVESGTDGGAASAPPG
jgi:hypothetical protein